jgi:hypothetical protein
MIPDRLFDYRANTLTGPFISPFLRAEKWDGRTVQTGRADCCNVSVLRASTKVGKREFSGRNMWRRTEVMQLP